LFLEDKDNWKYRRNYKRK